MKTQNQLGFVTDKIQQLQTAILECHSNSVLKIPRSVVQTLFVDEIGCVWIGIDKPKQYINEFDQSFHVALNYYKKGIPFFLNTFGLARVVADPEDISGLNPVLKEQYNNGKLILCIRIMEVNYYEKQPQVVQSFLQKCHQSISSLFVSNNEYYHFNIDDKQHYA